MAASCLKHLGEPFTSLDTRVVERLTGVARIDMPEEGQLIGHEGFPVRKMVVVLVGSVEASNEVANRTSGSFISGEEVLFDDPGIYQQSFVAGKCVILLTLTPSEFHECLRRALFPLALSMAHSVKLTPLPCSLLLLLLPLAGRGRWK